MFENALPGDLFSLGLCLIAILLGVMWLVFFRSHPLDCHDAIAIFLTLLFMIASIWVAVTISTYKITSEQITICDSYISHGDIYIVTEEYGALNVGDANCKIQTSGKTNATITRSDYLLNRKYGIVNTKITDCVVGG